LTVRGVSVILASPLTTEQSEHHSAVGWGEEVIKRRNQ
jgi:hypothetical protein